MEENEKIEKLKGIVKEFPAAVGNVKKIAELLESISRLDSNGLYFDVYLNHIKPLVDSVPQDSEEIIDVWNALWLELKPVNYYVFKRVVKVIENNPEKCLELCKTSSMDRYEIMADSALVKKILKKTLETEKQSSLDVFELFFEYGNVKNFEAPLVHDILESTSKQSVKTTLFLYNHLTEEGKKEHIKDIDISVLEETLQREIKNGDPQKLLDAYEELAKTSIPGIDFKKYKELISQKLRENSIEVVKDNIETEESETEDRSKNVSKRTIKDIKLIKGIFKKISRIKSWLKNSIKGLTLKEANKAIDKLEQHISKERNQIDN